MKLITAAQRAKLIENGKIAEQDPGFDPQPVVKLFNPAGAATWLLAWVEPQDEDIAFGLCDLGMGFPELGSVRLSELAEFRGRFGLGIERDQHWTATHPLSAYAKASKDHLVDRL